VTNYGLVVSGTSRHHSSGGGAGGTLTFVNALYGDKTLGTAASTVNTTGATLFVAVISGSSGVSISDSMSNTWNLLTSQTANGYFTTISYSFGVTTSASHTFTVAAGGSALEFVYAFGGATTTSACFSGQQNGTAISSVAIQPGSVTPAAGGVVVTGFGGVLNNSVGTTIDSGFATPQLAVANIQAGGSYLLTTGITPVNPTWTQGAGAGTTGAVIAAFNAA
jgi:hypothetical protein